MLLAIVVDVATVLRPAGGRRVCAGRRCSRWPARRRRAAATTRAHPKASAASAACPWVGSQAPISARVADVIDHMSLDDEITMVEGHGTAPPNPYVFYMPGIPDLCIPQLGEEDGPAGVADQLTNVTQLPAGVGARRHLQPVAGAPVRSGHRQRGVRQGRGGQPGPDGQHRPRPPLGPLVRDLHRGPVPQQRPHRLRDQGRPEHRRDVAGQALRRLQPGDQPQHAPGRRHCRYANAARDLRAGVPGGGGERQRRPR